MSAGQGSRVDPALWPEEFREAVERMDAAAVRPEVAIESMPAPQRIAPYAAALSADVTAHGDELATGRIVLLHDPAGNDAWGGTFRCVVYARAEIDREQAQDPLVGEVAWSWIDEALTEHRATAANPSGTVTVVSTESFGGMAEEEPTAQLEIRASWTPCDDVAGHVEAWASLLCQAAGLEPVPAGVTLMPSRRGQRGSR